MDTSKTKNDHCVVVIRRPSPRIWAMMQRRGVKQVPGLTSKTGHAGRPAAADPLGIL